MKGKIALYFLGKVLVLAAPFVGIIVTYGVFHGDWAS